MLWGRSGSRAPGFLLKTSSASVNALKKSRSGQGIRLLITRNSLMLCHLHKCNLTVVVNIHSSETIEIDEDDSAPIGFPRISLQADFNYIYFIFEHCSVNLQ